MTSRFRILRDLVGGGVAAVLLLAAIVAAGVTLFAFAFGGPLWIYEAGYEAGFRAAGGITTPESTWQWFWSGLGQIAIGLFALIGIGHAGEIIEQKLRQRNARRENALRRSAPVKGDRPE